MINYLADLVYIDKEGNAQLSYERVAYEDKTIISPTELIVLYVFDDASSVTIKYTKDKDYILKVKKGTLEAKLKKQY